MAVATFGMTWQVSGTQTFEIPDDIDLGNENAVSEYLLNHWSEIPIPENGEYVGDSDSLEGIYSVSRRIPETMMLSFTVERTERISFEKELTEAEYEEFQQTGEFSFDVYSEAGFTKDDGAEYDYAVTDDEGHTIVDWN